MKTCVLLTVLLFWAVTAQAQSVTNLQVTFMNGSQIAVAPFTIPFSAFTCSATRQPAPSGVIANPTKYQVDHPDDTALPEASRRQCNYNEVAGGPLFMLPFGTIQYTATSKWQNTAGLSEVSTASNPFSRPGSVPSAPVNLRIVGSGL